MKAAAVSCPPESELSDFALGKLDKAIANVVSHHLEVCEGCRDRVANLAGDSFVDLLREAHAPAAAGSGSLVPTSDKGRPGADSDRELSETTPLAASEAGQPATELPAAFGRYQVKSLLGGGGFGMVYLGYDPELRREVAIKVPRRERLSSPADAEAYLAEARLLAGLAHPGIVPVHDFGRTDDGLCHVVSQYVPGGDLAALLAQERPTLAKSVELAARIAEALHHAHEHGLVHRDIKPGNILLDQQGHPLVADFGLALTDDSYGRSPGVFGTPAYMSPEQARGESDLVDARSDIYSLGVLFYEMLVGRRPYRSSERRELLSEIAGHDVRPPRQLDHTIPKELERICLKALAKRPADRYTTAFDMAEDLRRWQSRGGATETESAGSPAAGDATVKNAAKSSRTFKVLIGCGGLLTLSVTATAAVLALTVWFRPPVQVAQNSADRESLATLRPNKPSPPVAPEQALRPVFGQQGVSKLAPLPSSAPLRVVSIDVQHFERVNEREAKRPRLLGQQSFSPRLGDQVTIKGRLSRPAFAYLVAFRPDGMVELCFPDDESQPPPLTDCPQYPPPGAADVRYGLADGMGLCVFAVVASEQPLPAWRDFLASHKPTWSTQPINVETVWWYDGQWIEPLTGARTGLRAKGERALGTSAAVVEIAEWLKKEAHGETAAAIGFGVGPRH